MIEHFMMSMNRRYTFIDFIIYRIYRIYRISSLATNFKNNNVIFLNLYLYFLPTCKLFNDDSFSQTYLILDLSIKCLF